MVDSSTSQSVVYVSVSKDILLSYGLQLLNLLIIVGLVTFGMYIFYNKNSYITSKTSYNIVIKPIERMTSMISKLAGTICILADDTSV